MDTQCTDHLGQIFRSRKAMLRFWKRSEQTYDRRIKDGWSQKDALEISTTRKKYIDHLGQEFFNKKEMCEWWKIDYNVFSARIKHGWSQKDALETPVKNTRKCVDHLGNEFSNITEMCKYWGIKLHIYLKRIKNDWPQKDALETPVREVTKYVDHLGNKFPSKEKMCEYWGVTAPAYNYRINILNISQKDALETPSLSLFLDDNLSSVISLEPKFYKVIYNNEVDIWTYDELMTYYRSKLDCSKLLLKEE